MTQDRSAVIALILTIIGLVWGVFIWKDTKIDKEQDKKEKIEDKKEKEEEKIQENLLDVIKDGGKEVPSPVINRLSIFLKNSDKRTKTDYLINLLQYNLSPKSYAEIFSKVDFNNISLSGIQIGEFQCFKEIYLANINLSESNLAKINFCGIPVSLTNSNLRSTKFYKTQMNNSSFKGANLYKTDFTEADLSFSDFSNSDLREANFEGALIFGLKLDNAKVSSLNWFEDLHTIYTDEAKGISQLEQRYEIKNTKLKDSISEYFLITEKDDYNIFPFDSSKINVNYSTYKNTQLGFEFLLAHNIFESDPTEWNINKSVGSVSFISLKGDAMLRIESQMFYNSSIECLENQVPSKYDNFQVTYKQPIKPNHKYLVRSGYIGVDDEYIFYEKFMLLDADRRYIHFQLIFPTRKKKLFDKITQYLAKTFKTI